MKNNWRKKKEKATCYRITCYNCDKANIVYDWMTLENVILNNAMYSYKKLNKQAKTREKDIEERSTRRFSLWNK